MTALETIWRVKHHYKGHENNGLLSWPEKYQAGEGAIQYTRTDLAESKTRAAVAAAYERAALEVDCGCGCRDEVLNAKTKVERWNACGDPSCSALAARDIRALTTAEHRSELEAVRREAFRAGFEQASIYNFEGGW